ncbi:K02A2.6-like [Cordylochernes scorpioides]|uniref:RNA-directed DNA polymerase n=1 Tax=Cordylochernes scorpioides TaxID=51811 RepID=A0ABY6KCU5_9ARAC|nr:K02A2.6-like [Cordylochernes scorpioides]
MDLRSGYWQIEVDKKDKEKTAFITPDGLYEFRVMPFGMQRSRNTEKQFYWDTAQEKAFEVLKTDLISEPVLGHFDESADTHLHTEASGHGIGAVLLQIQGGKERAIAYASRSLTTAEHNYFTSEKECLAVVWSISKFRPYLFGRPFTVVTDHQSLCWLVGQKDPSGRLARWALRLQEFDVTVIYKSGRKHEDADCLSRSPLENDQPSAVMSLTNVDIEQNKDPDLARIIDYLNSGYTRKEFSIIDGILYKKNYSTTRRPWLMMIPKHLRSEVIADLHDALTAGHLGFARTYNKVKKRFYWPGLYRTVRQYINALCGIVHRFTTAYHPQTYGLTERYVVHEHKDWDQVLPYVTFAYNTAKQEATGYTPFFLVHAREAETYIDAVLPYLPDEISDDYVGELVTRAEEARQLSRSRLLQSQAKDRRLHDQKHTPVYYQKDDLVWVFTPIRKVGLSEKLLKRFFGPYKDRTYLVTAKVIKVERRPIFPEQGRTYLPSKKAARPIREDHT